MKKVVLDTDILSCVLDKRSAEIAEIARQYMRVYRSLSISVVSVAEVIEGFAHIQDLGGKREFLKELETFEVLPVEVEEGVIAGEILGALRRAGQRIGDLDPFIAAVAISNERPLVTNNVKHYQRIVDLGFPLEIENWLGPE